MAFLHLNPCAPLGFGFRSRCPLRVSPDAVIVAVCDADDFENNASSTADGWLFSDFDLSHHLLKDTAHQQRSFPCVSHDSLASKYGKLIYGHAFGSDKKVVLDATVLEEI